MTSRAIADTSIFIAQESGRALNTSALPEQMAVSVITIGELRAGVLAATDVATRDRRLRTLTAAMQTNPIEIDVSIAESWATLRVTLREAGRRMPLNDSWIAATAMSYSVPVLTQDLDFPTLPGLDVIHV
ncbi:MAG: type II toxin-antitoxin system VapC family toxin [Acidimicrobiia bacterium]|nr:type II toxin-antitoxin system VapC family toxin [Acidimicrobiia bacterium]